MLKLPHWPVHTGYANPDSLAVMHKMLELLGNPHESLSKVIHVGGTNGKGSTIAFTAEILRSSGYSVNVYTSPHIFNFTERFNINGEDARHEDVFSALEEVRAVCEKNNISPTVLEASTAAAFYLFAKKKADFNIIECCMGGRFDCTNVFSGKNVVCTVVTSISKDHTKYLGETIGEIAYHKSGIQKDGIPSVIAKQREEDASRFLFNYASKFGVPSSFFGAEYILEEVEFDGDVLSQMKKVGYDIPKDVKFLYRDSDDNLIFLPKPSLLGQHQFENLATALRVCCVLGVAHEKIAKAVQNTKWIGRLQRVFNNSFPQSWELWFDGAHNAGGAQILAEWMVETQDERQNYVIIGKSSGANQVAFISAFKNVNCKIIFVTVKGEIFPETSTNLHNIAEKIGVPSLDGKTFEEVVKFLPRENIRIICCGSLYLLKDVVGVGNCSTNLT